MKRKIILKVKDLDFDNTRSAVNEAYDHAVQLLKLKGYFIDGVLLSIDSKIAYAWKSLKSVPPPPPTRRKHG